jgi:hypothetical protein
MAGPIARAVIVAVLWPGMMGCRRPQEPSRSMAEVNVKSIEVSTEESTQPPDDDDLTCLLETDHGRIHLQFGYRGCFGGSDNDLDLEVGATASVSGHLWTDTSTYRATEGVSLTREQGRAHLRRFVDALVKPDEASETVTTTTAFVRGSYRCGAHRSESFMVETNAPSREEEESALAAFKVVRDARHHPYSRVHATIAVAKSILELGRRSQGR